MGTTCLYSSISSGTSYVAKSTCLSSGNEKKDCGNFGWKDCSKALLRLQTLLTAGIVIKLNISWKAQTAVTMVTNNGMIIVAHLEKAEGGWGRLEPEKFVGFQ